MTKILHLTEEDEDSLNIILNYSKDNTIGVLQEVSERLINLLKEPAYNVLSLDRETLYEQLGEEVNISDEQLEELAYRVQRDIIQVGDFERLIKENYSNLSNE